MVNKTNYIWVGIVIIAIIVLVVFISNYSKPSQETVTCNPPYIKVGDSCCLDQNSNNICDKDETQNKIEETITPITSFEEVYQKTIKSSKVINYWDTSKEANKNLADCPDIKEAVYVIVHLDRINKKIQCQIPHTYIGNKFSQIDYSLVKDFYNSIVACDENTFKAYDEALSKGDWMSTSTNNFYYPSNTITPLNDVYVINWACISQDEKGITSLSPFFYDVIDSDTGKSLRYE